MTSVNDEYAVDVSVLDEIVTSKAPGDSQDEDIIFRGNISRSLIFGSSDEQPFHCVSILPSKTMRSSVCATSVPSDASIRRIHKKIELLEGLRDEIGHPLSNSFGKIHFEVFKRTNKIEYLI